MDGLDGWTDGMGSWLEMGAERMYLRDKNREGYEAGKAE